MIIIVMGVSGCGKTTLGEELAKRLSCGFSDADGFHPKANVEKMAAGIPLQDEDRCPWLASIREAIDGWHAKGESHIIACSALKEVYRDMLSPNGDVIFVYMKGSRETTRPRLKARKGHYMPPSLLDSQFNTLEEPKDALIVDIQGTPAEIADDVIAQLPKFASAEERTLL
ncbi:gluconokinase [Microvirga sp. W0021]|uniref:Gluconokinase n=1 Tax=Hohaiivirga grylli TaxID=3133970 RepID=A0ABV0BH39_9HYPH